MMRAFLDRTKCSPKWVEGITCSPGHGAKGFFRLGDLRLYGRTSAGLTSPEYRDNLAEIDVRITRGSGSLALPFDPTEIIDNLRLEKYVGAVNGEIAYIANNKSISRRVYYAVRPLFPVAFRRGLQRIALRDWAKIPFPTWPIDTTVEDIIIRLWTLVLEKSGEEEIPFIWYWPKGFRSCGIMTHDVETARGQEFCHTILAVEREYGDEIGIRAGSRDEIRNLGTSGGGHSPGGK